MPADAPDELFPEIEPYDTGLLDVGDGNQVYWECSGNPDGTPAVYLHGGPGGGSSPKQRRLFDPQRYRIVLLDQRNCGRSTPSASDPGTDLAANTTWHLVADLERLRAHLGIERWVVSGGSWGSALALAYAETHPDAVRTLVLRGIFTLRPRELEWFYEGGLEDIRPDGWAEFLAPVPESRRTRGGIIAAYADLLADPDPAVHLPAAQAWAGWEASSITLRPRPELVSGFTEPGYALAFARIESHYFTHGGWFEPEQLIRDAPRIAHIPTVIVQGRYDLCTPMVTAWELHNALPDADFVVADDAGHAFDEPGILRTLLAAHHRFADAS